MAKQLHGYEDEDAGSSSQGYTSDSLNTSDEDIKDIRMESTIVELQNTNISNKPTVHDFKMIVLLGKGGYGHVYQVSKNSGEDEDEIYAMKIVSKTSFVGNPKNLAHAISERNVLSLCRHPFIVDLKYAFQSAADIFLVMEYICGGELFNYLEDESRLSEKDAAFYVKEIVLALEYLHHRGIIYRDLKPENIMLDIDGHIKITDFGLCKENIHSNERSYTFCGTIDYMAPEVLKRCGHGKEADWWSLGALLYDMLTGAPPFASGNVENVKSKIKKGNYDIPHYLSPATAHFISSLMTVNPRKRLGATGAEDVKNHRFFKGTCWESVLNRLEKPPYVPRVKNKSDYSMFSKSFTNEKIPNFPGKLSGSGTMWLKDFSYQDSFMSRVFSDNILENEEENEERENQSLDAMSDGGLPRSQPIPIINQRRGDQFL